MRSLDGLISRAELLLMRVVEVEVSSLRIEGVCMMRGCSGCSVSFLRRIDISCSFDSVGMCCRWWFSGYG